MEEEAKKGGFTHTRLSESNYRKATTDSVESKHHFRDVISGQDIPKIKENILIIQLLVIK